MQQGREIAGVRAHVEQAAAGTSFGHACAQGRAFVRVPAEAHGARVVLHLHNYRLVCAVGQGFLVLLPGLQQVGSEERLTLGAGAVAHGLVATAAETGVQATGPIDDELLAVFESAEPIGVNHGYQNAGPFEPPAALRRAFADSCRKLRARGEV